MMRPCISPIKVSMQAKVLLRSMATRSTMTSSQNSIWLPFEDARIFVRSLGLKGQKEWLAYCKSGKKPDDIPANAPLVYKEGWVSWPDWLGTDTKPKKRKKKS